MNKAEKRCVLFLAVLALAAFAVQSVLAKRPLFPFDTEQAVTIDFTEHSDGTGSKHYGGELPPEEYGELQEILDKKAWLFSDLTSSFFLGQNSHQSENARLMLHAIAKPGTSPVHDDGYWLALEIYDNGVIWNIAEGKYAYLRLSGTKAEGKELYDELCQLVGPYLEKIY